MRMHKNLTRSLVAVLTAATVATSFPVSSASAAPAKKPEISEASTVDISARRRHYSRRGNNAAALGMFAAVAGTIGALAIASERRRAWRERHYYNGYGGPYGGYGYGYGPRYYRGW